MTRQVTLALTLLAALLSGGCLTYWDLPEGWRQTLVPCNADCRARAPRPAPTPKLRAALACDQLAEETMQAQRRNDETLRALVIESCMATYGYVPESEHE